MTRRVVLDSNLLLLLVVGLASRQYVGQHKRLAAYTAEDFDLLVEALQNVDEILITPNTLTETSNLLSHANEPRLGELRAVFRDFVEKTPERIIASRVGVAAKEFPRLGLTDAVLLELVNDNSVLLTADLDLFLAAQRVAHDRSLNFHHLRDLKYNS